MPKTQPKLRILQLSDMHLCQRSHQPVFNTDTEQALHDLVSYLHQHEHADVMLLTGDLSQDGSKESYERLAAIFSILNFPIYYIPGNHDDIDHLSKFFSGSNIFHDKLITKDHWQIILLDSTAPGLNDGFLSTVDYEHLEYCLRKYPKQHALIALHHPPLKINCPYMDEARLINDEAFLARLHAYPQVRSIIFGHIHQEYSAKIQNIHFLGTPSTAMQFKPHSKKFALDTLSPGYRWLELSKEGKLKTGIKRLAF